MGVRRVGIVTRAAYMSCHHFIALICDDMQFARDDQGGYCAQVPVKVAKRIGFPPIQYIDRAIAARAQQSTGVVDVFFAVRMINYTSPFEVAGIIDC